jgi:hypothetical protein
VAVRRRDAQGEPAEDTSGLPAPPDDRVVL